MSGTERIDSPRHVVAAPQRTPTPLVRVLRDPTADIQRRPLSWKLVSRLWRLMRTQARKRNALVVLVILRAIQLPLLAWSIGAVINGPITRGDSVTAIFWASCGVLLLAAVTQWTLVYRQWLAFQVGERIVHDLRGELFRHLQRMPMSYYSQTKTGRVISRMTSDCEAVRNGVQNVFFVTLVQAGQMIGAAVVMAWYDLPLFGVVISLAPVVWWIGRVMQSRLGQAYRDVQESFSRVTSTIAESVAIIRVTQAMAREEMNSQMFRDLTGDHARYNMSSAKQAGLMMPLLELTGQVSLALVIAVGGYRAIVAEVPMPVGDLIQFWFLAGLFFSPIQVLGSQYDAALSAMAGAERVFGLLDTPPAWSDTDDAVPLKEPVRGELIVRDVAFGYDPQRPVLQDIDLHAMPGQMIALVGETGSGKSTLASLIARFYLPDRGTILIDGQDIRHVTTASLASQIAVVQQQNFLFTGTVLQNLIAGRPGATRDDAVAALRSLGCESLIDDLADGLDTEAGSRGGKVSLGQRQLLCFARALVTDPGLLILDEATSAIDTLTELKIQTAMQKLLSGRTSIVIAHRLSTIRAADQILVMEHGRIVQRGRHEELLRQSGIYAGLYQKFISTSNP